MILNLKHDFKISFIALLTSIINIFSRILIFLKTDDYTKKKQLEI